MDRPDRPDGPDPKLTSFYRLLVGQSVSMFGTGLTSFALAVYVYEEMGSVTRFALVALAAILPGLLIGPTAGVWVDRWDRRRTILWTDSLAAIATLALAVRFFLAGGLGLPTIFAAVIFFSVLGAFQRPAILSSVPLLVAKEQLTRANGALQFIEVIPQILAPIVAGFLLVSIGLGGVMVIDVVTFLFALATLLTVHIPKPVASTGRPRPMGGQIAEARRFITSHPGLIGLLTLSTVASFALAMMQLTLQPLVLDLASAATLGVVVSLGNIGLLVGSVLITAWGGAARKIDVVLGCCALLGVGMVIAGLRPSIPWIVAGFFIVTLSVPVRGASAAALWQTKTPADRMGRVLALRQTLIGLSIPLAYVLAGPLVDRLFNPWMAPGGRLEASVGQMLGVGPGRGIGLLFVVVGGLTLTVTLFAALVPSVRRVERDVPDADTETPRDASDAPAAVDAGAQDSTTDAA
ncbi:MAG: MFS transporter [Acidobacteriota bacterium]